MKYDRIDTSILPKAWLHWETKKDKFWVNCETNVKQNCAPDIAFGWRNKEEICRISGSRPLYAYAKYHEDIGRLELAGMTFDTRRTADSHEWQYAGNRYFIDKNKNVFDKEGKLVTYSYILDPQHYAYDFKNFLQMYHRCDATDAVVKEFHKFLGSTSFTNGNGKSIEAQWTWHIHEWYIRKQKSVTQGTGKQQKLTNELTAIPLSDFSGFTEKYPPVEYMEGRWQTKANNIIYFERVNENWSVLRVLRRFIRYDSSNQEYFKETERFYIGDNGANRIVTPAKDGWTPTKQINDYDTHVFVNKDEAMEKCKRLKYILPLFDENDYKIKRRLFNALRFPEIEQLIKMDHKATALSLASSYTPKAEIKERFGDYYNEKEKNLLRKIGMTKHQLDKHLAPTGANQVSSYYRSSGTLIKTMREFFGADFIHLDNATFDRYYEAFNVILSRCGSRFSYTFNCINVDQKKFIRNMVRLGEKNEQAYMLIMDTISTYNYLNRGTRPEIDWYFGSYSDVVRAHDAFTAMHNLQEAERRAQWNASEAERMKKDEEKRIKIDEKRKEYEYEDDNFVIRLPKDGAEITKEGIAQHICIGGYVSRHSRGDTNLFFLRKKSAPDIPFYAIEMTNAKRINQIHGFGNKWLGNNPEAIPTVIRWLRKNGISCDKHILTCTAIGYGSTDNHVQMPVVD